MSDEIKAPRLSYEEIRRRADEFLHRYNPKGKLPVPIEEIVEFEFGINIIPSPDLHKLFEIDGFTSSDLQDISVDQYVYENRLVRYRFTLAHEVGHVVLHAALYSAAKFQRVAEWMHFVNSIPEDTHQWLEYQAYSFGGLVLVPRAPLKVYTKEAVDQIRKESVDLKKNWDFAWQVIADVLAKRFEVSTEVIERRLTLDKIRETFR